MLLGEPCRSDGREARRARVGPRARPPLTPGFRGHSIRDAKDEARTTDEPDWASHRRALYRFVSYRIVDRAAAEDVVQETQAKALARRDTLRNPEKLRRWLYQIARNAVADYHRSRGGPGGSHVLLPEDLAAEVEDSGPERGLAPCLAFFVDRLPPEYGLAIRLSYLQGLTQRETAASLGLSVPGAKSRIQRARGKLAAMLGECCNLEFDHGGRLAGFEPVWCPEPHGCCK